MNLRLFYIFSLLKINEKLAEQNTLEILSCAASGDHCIGFD